MSLSLLDRTALRVGTLLVRWARRSERAIPLDVATLHERRQVALRAERERDRMRYEIERVTPRW